MPELRAIHTAELLRDVSERSPLRNALIHVERGVRYTYKEFTHAIDQLARGLIGLGIKKDGHVAIWAANLPEWAITMFAIARIGGVLVSVDPFYQADQVEYLLRQSDSQTLVFMKGSKGDEFLRILLELAPDLGESEPGLLRTHRLPQLKNIILISEDTFPGVFLWKQVLEKGEDVPPLVLEERTSKCQPDDIFTLLYTSGTTGPPKGVMSSHVALISKSIASAEFQRLSERDRLCLPIPLFHMFGCICVLLTAVAWGATAVIPSETFDPTMTLRAIEQEKCTALYGAPSLFISLLEHPQFDDFDLSSLRTGIIGGSPCPLEVMKQVVERMGAREITIGYGATEASSWITQTKTDDPLEARVSTIGRACPHIEVKIVDPRSGHELPDEVQGELCTRGLLMKGYYQMPAATAEAIDQGGCCTQETWARGTVLVSSRSPEGSRR